MASTYAPPPALLQAPVFSPNPLSNELKEAVAFWMWPQPAGQPQQQSLDDLDAYFTYFAQECSPPFSSQNAMQRFDDLVLVLNTLRDNDTTKLQDIRTLIANGNAALAADTRKLSTSIELVVRLWLMTNVRIVMPTHRHLLETGIPWPEDQSLVEILARHITQPSAYGLSTAESFSVYFNVIDMRNIVNFQVLWTNNLAEHLVTRGTFIYIFHQVSALRCLKSSQSGPTFLPVALIDETFTTLNLLVPHNMSKCNIWLREEIRRVGLDRNIMYRQTADRDKRAYPFWAEKLGTLFETFQRTKPSSPTQWWYDRRDMGQWWGFWLVAVGLFLTLLFGLVQSITGILQVTLPK